MPCYSLDSAVMPPSLQEQMKRCVLPLAATTGQGEWIGLGTAFVVGVADGKTAFLLTAAHSLHYATTLDPYLRRSAASPLPGISRAAPPQLGTTKVYVILSGAPPARMDMAWWRDDSDIALLSVTLSDDAGTAFDVRLPIDSTPAIPVGTSVSAFGYPSFRSERVEEDYAEQRFRARVSFDFEGRAGEVVEHVEAHGIHSGAGVLISCPLDSGMSGGPVVESRDGRIVARAVVGSDLADGPRLAVGSGARAFAGLLLPSLGIKAAYFDVYTEATGSMQDPTILDLVRGGVIEDLGVEASGEIYRTAPDS